jgi:hypothetical protein
MIKIIFIYAISILYFAITGYVFLPLIYLLKPLIKRHKYLLPIHFFIFDFISKCLAISLVIVTSSWLDIQPTFLMIFIPTILLINNDLKRISFAEKGISRVAQMLKYSGESEIYDQKMDIINEYAHLVGDISGLIFGLIYILGKVPIA